MFRALLIVLVMSAPLSAQITIEVDPTTERQTNIYGTRPNGTRVYGTRASQPESYLVPRNLNGQEIQGPFGVQRPMRGGKPTPTIAPKPTAPQQQPSLEAALQQLLERLAAIEQRMTRLEQKK